jgi:predicted amidophosphoribosyltransferase
MLIHILTSLIDAVFPPSPSHLLLRQISDVDWVSYMRPRKIDEVLCLSPYQVPAIKAAVTAGKFEHNTHALHQLGMLLHTYLGEYANTFPPQTLFVPVPLHPTRHRERGYNQVTEILRTGLAGTPYRTVSLLRRQLATSPQSHLKRADRITHLKGAFTYHATRINWSTIEAVVLCDDVMTTGSTLEACRLTLRPELPPHVKLYLLAIAH